MSIDPSEQILEEQLACMASGSHLSQNQVQASITLALQGAAPAAAVRRWLVALAEKGETVEELVGAARAMRAAMVRLHTSILPIVDTCGTGGDGAKTFNISTAAAIVAAAAGVTVAKHGNRKITSATGSADVLAELGVNLEADVATVERCLNELGICFCFAPLFHPAMKYVGEIRRSIPRPTIFNRLGPLANPALADCQVLGVGDVGLQDKLAQALQQLGTTHSLVVRGEDGVDEISLSSATRVLEVTPKQIVEHCWTTADFGIAEGDRSKLFADDPASSAACIRAVFNGELGARRDVVVLNAAAALWVAGKANSLREATEKTQAAIDSQAASRLLFELGKLSYGS